MSAFRLELAADLRNRFPAGRDARSDRIHAVLPLLSDEAELLGWKLQRSNGIIALGRRLRAPRLQVDQSVRMDTHTASVTRSDRFVLKPPFFSPPFVAKKFSSLTTGDAPPVYFEVTTGLVGRRNQPDRVSRLYQRLQWVRENGTINPEQVSASYTLRDIPVWSGDSGMRTADLDFSVSDGIRGFLSDGFHVSHKHDSERIGTDTRVALPRESLEQFAQVFGAPVLDAYLTDVIQTLRGLTRGTLEATGIPKHPAILRPERAGKSVAAWASD